MRRQKRTNSRTGIDKGASADARKTAQAANPSVEPDRDMLRCRSASPSAHLYGWLHQIKDMIKYVTILDRLIINSHCRGTWVVGDTDGYRRVAKVDAPRTDYK